MIALRLGIHAVFESLAIQNIIENQFKVYLLFQLILKMSVFSLSDGALFLLFLATLL